MVDRPSGCYNVSYSQETAIVRTRLQWVILIAGLVFLFSVPLFASKTALNFLTFVGISVIAVHGLNILTGLCGQISLGHAAFVGVGAFTSAALTSKLGLSWWLTVPCAGLSASIVGLIFGLPALRLKGFYLAMSTLAAQFIIIWIMLHWVSMTGGPDGTVVERVTLGAFTFKSSQSMYLLVMGMAIIATFVAKNIARSQLGRAFIAVRDNDIAAEVMGINPAYYKLVAFSIASFFAGVAGAIFAPYAGAISYEHFGLMDSIWYLGMMIVGGMGSSTGVILGVAAIRGLEEMVMFMNPWIATTFPALQFKIAPSVPGIIQMLFGLVIVLFLVFEPRGLAHRWELIKASYRLWPLPY